jgi:glucose/arabinose dehydrogenase
MARGREVVLRRQRPQPRPLHKYSTPATFATAWCPLPPACINPWSLAFLPDGGLLIAEKNGQLRLMRNGVLLPTPVWKASPRSRRPTASTPFAVHPQFAQNHYIYLSYPKQGPRGTTMAVARGRLENDALVDVKDIFVAEAWDKRREPGRPDDLRSGQHDLSDGRRSGSHLLQRPATPCRRIG